MANNLSHSHKTNVGVDLKAAPRVFVKTSFLSQKLHILAKTIEEKSKSNPYLKAVKLPESVKPPIQSEFGEISGFSGASDDKTMEVAGIADLYGNAISTTDHTKDLRAGLLEEINNLKTTKRKKQILQECVDYLTPKGFLPEHIRNSIISSGDFCKTNGVTNDELNQCISILSEIEPIGVGARHTGEYLHAVLSDDGGCEESTLSLLEALTPPFNENAIDNAARQAKLDNTAKREALEDISFIAGDRMFPSYGWHLPTGQGFLETLPDFRVILDENSQIKVESSVKLGELEMVEPDEPLEDEDNKQELQWEARQLLKRIKHQSNAEKLIQCLFEYQKDYILKGPEHIKSMTRTTLMTMVKEVHSDWSLKKNSVYYLLQDKTVAIYDNRRGINHLTSLSLDVFFDSGVTNKSGQNFSRAKVKSLIKRLILTEDPKAPLSDDKIRETLELWGVKISRKGVEKYRKAPDMGFESARKRRQK
jgi:RNA polymerase sigma-54 factor